MWRIYGEGQTKYRDERVYEAEFLGENNPKRRLIDETGHPEGYHERANAILQRYGKIAYDIMKKEYDKNPVVFQKELMKPEVMQLLIEKTRLGQVSVFMTANQRDFAMGLVAFSELWKYGLALATDETMAGGGKEIAIRKLIKQVEATTGAKVNKERCTAIGDSIKGDVGSGVLEGLGSGIVITETPNEVEAIIQRGAEGNSDDVDRNKIREILDGKTRVEAIATRKVRKSEHAVYSFGLRSSKKKK